MPRLLVVLALVLSPSLLRAADPPAVKREFRGVWVATVANIDWPSKRGLSAAEQKKELVALLSKFQALNFNAVVFQVRPMCDALYESKLEPWSEYLTGVQGKSLGYDPLAFAVAEAHKRGLELHAWFNPYRAWSPSARSPATANHVTKARPDLAKEYGKHHWLNPTHPEVSKHSLAVMLDVVNRYDIDGVHLDDYFYPYPEKDDAGAEIPFPDDDTWAAYQKDGGKLARDDWRRDAVNRFVKQLYGDVKAAKPWVKVGISPFGIWRPGHPQGIEGFDQHGKLYADAKLWLSEGWVDYFTPQLYWPIAQQKQSYPKLLAWWAGENPKGRHLWPGNIPSRVTGEAKGWPATEIADQIAATRKQPGASGNIHFSAKPILANRGGLADVFEKVYDEPALVPASPWLSDNKPSQPTIDWGPSNNLRHLLQIQPAKSAAKWYVIRTQVREKWRIEVRASDGPTVFHGVDRDAVQVIVTAVDRYGTEGEPVKLKR